MAIAIARNGFFWVAISRFLRREAPLSVMVLRFSSLSNRKEREIGRKKKRGREYNIKEANKERKKGVRRKNRKTVSVNFGRFTALHPPPPMYMFGDIR